MTPGKGKPFYFDFNVFDDGATADADDPPPPPVFSEDELEQAKKQAYEQGKKAGFAESQAGLTRDILNLIQGIKQASALLFAAEDERRALYEYEAVHLTAALFSKLFPVYLARYGFDEMKEQVLNILRSQRSSQEITIEIPENLENPVREFFLSQPNFQDNKIILKPASDLNGSQCRLFWSDGGAIHDPINCAESTLLILKESLLLNGITPHDDLKSIAPDCTIQTHSLQLSDTVSNEQRDIVDNDLKEDNKGGLRQTIKRRSRKTGAE